MRASFIFKIMEKIKPIIWIVGGGEVFSSREKYLEWCERTPFYPPRKNWKDWLAHGLSDNYDVKRISLPDKTNADYDAWKIWFEKYIDLLDTNAEISLIGHSLGGIFLAKYLSENTFIRQIRALHLIAPVWSHPESILHNTGNFSFEANNLKKISSQCDEIHIWASRDDDIVNFEDSEKYFEYLPKSEMHIFGHRGHFLQAHFVELFQTFL